MADLAVTFHWRPSDMDGMSMSELAAWRERARVRTEVE
ncbi:GpE family phage tail protein [Laribacter hongkongensis]|uniref:GpE family phage tail protein n=1 Tax=Laribacter hongkongensis TaxID=168471 RepID=A0ABD4SWJ4_9NEIS|nr:GpE family phage tail protein [Laribacter hongkongensis]MCG9027075.1 GpE family phage tail protein [Laribacter hongkongensis]